MIHTVLESPIGDLLLLGADSDDGFAVCGLYTALHVRRPLEVGQRQDSPFEQAREELAEYFDGRRTEFQVRISLRGTPFQQSVWARLREIGYGQTASYGEIASQLGNPNAVRAVGSANGRNPISIVVGCHRVVGGNGALTGYAGGLAAKAWLLTHEAARVATCTVDT